MSILNRVCGDIMENLRAAHDMSVNTFKTFARFEHSHRGAHLTMYIAALRPGVQDLIAVMSHYIPARMCNSRHVSLYNFIVFVYDQKGVGHALHYRLGEVHLVAEGLSKGFLCPEVFDDTYLADHVVAFDKWSPAYEYGDEPLLLGDDRNLIGRAFAPAPFPELRSHYLVRFLVEEIEYRRAFHFVPVIPEQFGKSRVYINDNIVFVNHPNGVFHHTDVEILPHELGILLPESKCHLVKRLRYLGKLVPREDIQFDV